jgi:hypothetical protein
MLAKILGNVNFYLLGALLTRKAPPIKALFLLVPIYRDCRRPQRMSNTPRRLNIIFNLESV